MAHELFLVSLGHSRHAAFLDWSQRLRQYIEVNADYFEET
jgi:hypothetical protein